MHFTMKQTLSSRAWRLSLLSALILLCAIALPQAALAGGYCAIAYSRSTGKWGDSYSYGSRASAERAALRNCGARGSFIAGWGHNQHIALAVGHGGAWGFGVGASKDAAGRSALRHCPANDAHILRYVYSFD